MFFLAVVFLYTRRWNCDNPPAHVGVIVPGCTHSESRRLSYRRVLHDSQGLCIEILQRLPKPAVSAVPHASHERLVATSHCP